LFDAVQPWWLLPGLFYPLVLWLLAGRSSELPHPRVQSRNRKSLLLHGLSVLTLLLAAAGLQLTLQAPHRQLVVAADVSDSVFDLPTQDARLRQLLTPLNQSETDIAIAVFGKNTGIEQPLRPLPVLTPQTQDRRRATTTGLPSVARPTSLIDRSASDIGTAIQTARGLFDSRQTGSRAILLLSDFRDTAGRAAAGASALNGSGIDLLTAPVLLGPSADVCLAALELPPTATVGRAVPIEVTLTAQSAANVRVSVWRRQPDGEEAPVGFKTVTLEEAPLGTSERRVAVRFLDTPAAPGVAVYSARVTGSEGELPGDILTNNTLAAAVRVLGPSKWAVLTKNGSTLARIASQADRPLGVDATLFPAGSLPANARDYTLFSGILLDGLSARDLPEGPALEALTDAVESGKALVALGGENALGNGGHRDGALQRLLPVEMTPEDDRTRSILFLIDVSKSMDEKLRRGGNAVTKKDFAAEQLAQVVQKLKAHDRLGLIAFSGGAQLTAPLSNDPARANFLAAVRAIRTEAQTDLLAALRLARETLAKDDAEEQLVVMLSDGVQTAKATAEEIVAEAEKLCVKPASGQRRTTLFTFGIGVDASDANPVGEELLKKLATSGGGSFSPEFLKLAERLEQTFEGRNKDFFVRREPFGLRAAYPHPLLGAPNDPWPNLSFRNRVKPKASAETLLWSAPVGSASGSARRPDPLLILSGSSTPGLARRAVLPLTLDGAAGAQLLSAASGQRVLPSLLAWAEGRDANGDWSLQLESGRDGALQLRAIGRSSDGPLNGKRLRAILQRVDTTEAADTEKPAPDAVLLATGPGEYVGALTGRTQGVYRVTLRDGDTPLLERFITLPYPDEVRTFGVDRAAMQDLLARAGGSSRAIEAPQDLTRWVDEQFDARRPRDLAPVLLLLALGLILAQVYVRSR